MFLLRVRALLLQVLRAWRSHCVALSEAACCAEERFVAAQLLALRSAVHAWSSAARSAVQRRMHAEKAVLHLVRSQQARALHAWITVIRYRRWKHTALLEASNHFRHSRMSSTVSHWHSWACNEAQSARSLAHARARRHAMHVVRVLGVWRHAARQLTFEKAMLPVAELQRDRALVTLAFHSCAAFAKYNCARAEKKDLLAALTSKRKSDSALAVWHSQVKHARKQQSMLKQFRSFCATRKLGRSFGEWCKVVEAMHEARRAAEAAAVCKRDTALVQVVREWHACAEAIRGARRHMETALLHWTSRCGLVLFSDNSRICCFLPEMVCCLGMLLCLVF